MIPFPSRLENLRFPLTPLDRGSYGMQKVIPSLLNQKNGAGFCKPAGVIIILNSSKPSVAT